MTEIRTYTPEEYALKMRVSVKTIYRQIRSGSLKAEKVGHQWRIVRLVVQSSPRAT